MRRALAAAAMHATSPSDDDEGSSSRSRLLGELERLYCDGVHDEHDRRRVSAVLRRALGDAAAADDDAADADEDDDGDDEGAALWGVQNLEAAPALLPEAATTHHALAFARSVAADLERVSFAARDGDAPPPASAIAQAAAEAAAAYLSELPPPLKPSYGAGAADRRKSAAPWQALLAHPAVLLFRTAEVRRHAAFLALVRSDLEAVAATAPSDAPPPPAVVAAVGAGEVPPAWVAAGFPTSERRLDRWLAQLRGRVGYWSQWVQRGAPNHLSLAACFRPVDLLDVLRIAAAPPGAKNREAAKSLVGRQPCRLPAQ